MSTAKHLTTTITWRGMVLVSSFLLNLFIARIYGPEISGLFFYSLNIYALLILIFSLSLESAFGFYTSTREIPQNRLLAFAATWIAVALAILSIIYFFTKDISWLRLSSDALAFVAGNMLMGFMGSILYARRQFIIPNVVILGMHVCLLILVLNQSSLLNIISANEFLVLYQWAFFVCGMVLTLFVYLFNPVKWEWPSFSDSGKVFRYAALAWVGNIVFFFLYRIDYWFVEAYCTAEELGNYIQVSRMAQLFFVLPTIIASVIFPLTAGGNKEHMQEVVLVISRVLLLFYSIVCIILVLTGNWIFPFLFGPGYTLMYSTFLFIIPGILSLAMLYSITAFFSGNNRLKLNLVACTIALIVMIAGDLLFIPRFGIHAAAAVSSISYIVLQVLLFYFFKKYYKVNLLHFFIFQKKDILLLKSYFTGSIRKP